MNSSRDQYFTTQSGESICYMCLKPIIIYNSIIIGVRNAATRSVKQSLLFVGSENGKILAVRQLIRKGVKPPVLIFVQSKVRAVGKVVVKYANICRSYQSPELFHELVYDGINVDVIHADRTNQQVDKLKRCCNFFISFMIARQCCAKFPSWENLGYDCYRPHGSWSRF